MIYFLNDTVLAADGAFTASSLTSRDPREGRWLPVWGRRRGNLCVATSEEARMPLFSNY